MVSTITAIGTSMLRARGAMRPTGVGESTVSSTIGWALGHSTCPSAARFSARFMGPRSIFHRIDAPASRKAMSA